MSHSSFVPLLGMSLHCHVFFLNICFIHIVAFPETLLKKLVQSILFFFILQFYNLNESTFLSCIDLVNVLYLEILFFLLVQFVYKQGDSFINSY